MHVLHMCVFTYALSAALNTLYASDDDDGDGSSGIVPRFYYKTS